MKKYLKKILVRLFSGVSLEIYKNVKKIESENMIVKHVNENIYKECAEYILKKCREAVAVSGDKWNMRLYAISQIKNKGSILEFGVWQGTSFLWFTKKYEGNVFGFDSFQGLPEVWSGTNMSTDKFNLGGKVPKKLKSFYEKNFIYAGLFKDTLPRFLKERSNESISLLHMDADLYSSTYYVLSTLLKKKKLTKGSLILFDNYFGYPGWKMHEHKVLQDLLKGRYRYLAYGGGCRCLVKII